MIKGTYNKEMNVMKTLNIPYELLQTIVSDETFSDSYRVILSHCDISEDSACNLARQILQAFFANAKQFGLDIPQYTIPEAEPFGSTREPSFDLDSEYQFELKVGQEWMHIDTKNIYTIIGPLRVRMDVEIGWNELVEYQNKEGHRFAQPLSLFLQRFARA